MKKYVFIVLLILVILLVLLFVDQPISVEEPFTPYLRQQFRQRSRQFRLGFRDRRKRANAWLSRMIGRYGLGF